MLSVVFDSQLLITIINTSVSNFSTFAPWQDVGYGSTRSNTPRDREFEERDRSLTEVQLRQLPEIDVGLMLKLQQKLKEVEKERDRLFDQLESLEKDDSPTEEKQETIDKLKVQKYYVKLYFSKVMTAMVVQIASQFV